MQKFNELVEVAESLATGIAERIRIRAIAVKSELMAYNEESAIEGFKERCDELGISYSS